MHKLTIITTHPIQYNAPLFRLLAERGKILIKVFYTLSQFKDEVKDEGFGRVIKWDIPVLEGYDHTFVDNISKKPSTKHRKGIINPDLIQEIEKWNPDVILVYGWNFVSHMKVIRHFKGIIPVLFRGDSTLLDEQPGFRKILRRLYLHWVYRNVDYALYMGTQNKRYVLVHGFRESQLVFAPHAVDNERFFDSPEKKYEEQARHWRRELGFKEKNLVILFAGKFEPKKDPLLLLKAVKQINNSIESCPSPNSTTPNPKSNSSDSTVQQFNASTNTNQQFNSYSRPQASARPAHEVWQTKRSTVQQFNSSTDFNQQSTVQQLNSSTIKLLFVGNGVLEDELKSQTNGDPDIRFLPFQNQSLMPVVYRLGDIFCLPSVSETWGLAVNEAMACEQPVLVSDKVGCAVDLVTEHKNGWIFQAGNINDLVNKLKWFRDHPQELKSMGANGKDVVKSRTFENVCIAIENIVHSL